MVHLFLVDLNDLGHYYRVGIETSECAEVVESYLQKFSHDVRYEKSKEERARNYKGNRTTPVGTICFCAYNYDKLSTFKRCFSPAEVDKRHSLPLFFDEGGESIG